ncbi:hypothetical protein N8Z95_00600 [bacterium]|nr:hypothetical protein [bacterium]
MYIDEPIKTGYFNRADFFRIYWLTQKLHGKRRRDNVIQELCIPVYGNVVALVHFWGVIFKRDEQFNKYKDNPKFRVWGN